MVWDNKRNVLFWQLQLVERCQVDQNHPQPPAPKKRNTKKPKVSEICSFREFKGKKLTSCKNGAIYTKNKGCVAVCQVPSVDIFFGGGGIFSPCFASRVMFARVLKTVIFAVPFSASCQVAKLKHERFQWRVPETPQGKIL